MNVSQSCLPSQMTDCTGVISISGSPEELYRYKVYAEMNVCTIKQMTVFTFHTDCKRK